MKIIKKLLLSLTVVMLFTQCDVIDNLGQDLSKSDFITNTNYGVYDGAKAIFEYKADAHQVAYSSTPTYQFRVQTDSQSQYFLVELPSLPSTVDQNVEVKVVSQAISGLSGVSALSMTVAKVSSDAVWLWAADKSIGFIVAK